MSNGGSGELHFDVVLGTHSTQVGDVVLGSKVTTDHLAVTEEMTGVGNATCRFQTSNNAQMTEISLGERPGTLVEPFEGLDHRHNNAG